MDRDDQLPDAAVGDVIRGAEAVQLLASGAAEARFKRIRPVVKTRVNHPAIVAGLVRRHAVLGLEDHDGPVPLLAERVRRRQPHNAATYDRHINACCRTRVTPPRNSTAILDTHVPGVRPACYRFRNAVADAGTVPPMGVLSRLWCAWDVRSAAQYCAVHAAGRCAGAARSTVIIHCRGGRIVVRRDRAEPDLHSGPRSQFERHRFEHPRCNTWRAARPPRALLAVSQDAGRIVAVPRRSARRGADLSFDRSAPDALVPGMAVLWTVDAQLPGAGVVPRTRSQRGDRRHANPLCPDTRARSRTGPAAVARRLRTTRPSSRRPAAAEFGAALYDRR